MARRAIGASEVHLHPSVLITCSVPAASGPVGDGQPKASSGSGFILDPGRGLIMTSTSWMVDHLPNKYKYQRTSFHLPEKATWRVFAQIASRDFAAPGRDSGVICLEVRAVGSYLMDPVYSALEEQLTTSLGQWKFAASWGEASPQATTEELQDFQSLLVSLSTVVVLQLSSSTRTNPNVRISRHVPSVGGVVSAVGTPMGSFCPEVFLASMSTGCVSKMLGREAHVFVTDAHCLPGCEGAMVIDGSALSSYMDVVGMVMAPLLTPAGNPSGLSLVCSIDAVLTATGHAQNSHRPLTYHRIPTYGKVSYTIVAVAGGKRRGTGVLVSPNTVLTCGHVVNDSKVCVAVQLLGARTQIPGKVVFSLVFPDVALIKLEIPVSSSQILESINSTAAKFSQLETVSLADGPYNISTEESLGNAKPTRCKSNMCVLGALEGDQVFAIGYGLQELSGSLCLQEPLVTSGVVSKVVRWRGTEVMLRTTAVVHPGMSGGLIVSASTGIPIGIIVSNSHDQESGVTYPDVNYCLPLSWILPAVLGFCTSGQLADLSPLCSAPRGARQLWNLGTQFSELHRSKL